MGVIAPMANPAASPTGGTLQLHAQSIFVFTRSLGRQAIDVLPSHTGATLKPQPAVRTMVTNAANAREAFIAPTPPRGKIPGSENITGTVWRSHRFVARC